MELLKNLVQIDAVNVSVVGNKGVMHRFCVELSRLAYLLTSLNNSNLSNECCIWIFKSPGYETPNAIIRLLVANLPCRFSCVRLEFQTDNGYSEPVYFYDRDARSFDICEVSEPDIFNFPVFRSGAITQICINGNRTCQESVDVTIDAIEDSELRPKKIAGECSVFIDL